MGDGDKTPLRLQFNPKVRLEFHGATITSDAGLLPIRELDDALGLTHIAADYLQESRSGRNIRHHLVPLLRQSIYSRLAGYDDTNDAERLSQDPAMRVVVGWQGSDRNAASTNTVSRFETETLTQQDNLQGLARMNPQWVEDAMAHTPHQRVILDMDSSESPVHGHQEGAAYNGHFECVCYHPLFLFNQFGDCEGATLRPGNVHSAEGWQELLEPVVKRYQRKGRRLLFRGDAAFGKPEVYEYLEQEMIGYAIRLSANAVLQREIAHLLVRPADWSSRRPIVSYYDFTYQAQSWSISRRVVAKVEWHQGELFPRVGFIVTNLSYPPKGIVRFYNGRGTAEQWIKEGKYALNWTRLSCHKFVANQARLWLFVLAYNLGNFMRRLALPEDMKHWTLTSLQTRLIKTGGRLVRHARRMVFQLAEVLVTREMQGHQKDMLRLLGNLKGSINVPVLDNYEPVGLDFGLEDLWSPSDLARNQESPLLDRSIVIDGLDGPRSAAVYRVIRNVNGPQEIQLVPEVTRLWRALKEHIRQDPLWRHEAAWLKSCLDELNRRAELNRAIRKNAERIFGLRVGLGGGPSEPWLAPGAIVWIRTRLTNEALGTYVRPFDEDLTETSPGSLRSLYGQELTVGIEEPQDKLQQTLLAMEGSREVAAATESYKDLQEMTENIHDAIDEYLLIHYITGACGLCRKLGGQ